MSGGTEVSGWTVDTLREFIMKIQADQVKLLDERFATQTKAVDAAFAAAEKAVQMALESAEKSVAKAEISVERRFESVNEFRAQLSDQAGTFLSRNEYSTAHQALIDKVEVNARNINDRLDRTTNQDAGGKRMETANVIQWLVLAALFLGMIVNVFFLIRTGTSVTQK